MTQILIGELQVNYTELDSGHLETGVDSHIQAFQVTLIDGEPGCRGSIAIRMSKSDAQLVHATNRCERGTRHHELVIRRLIRLAGIVGAGINFSAVGRTADLAEVLIREFEIFDAECHGAHFEIGIHCQIQAFQIPLIDAESGGPGAVAIFVPKCHTQAINPTYGHRCRP